MFYMMRLYIIVLLNKYINLLVIVIFDISLWNEFFYFV